MTVTLDIPEELAEELAAGGVDVAERSRDLLLIDVYKEGRISISRLGVLLGGDRWTAEAWLAEHGVGPNYGTADFEDDVKTLDALNRREG